MGRVVRLSVLCLLATGAFAQFRGGFRDGGFGHIGFVTGGFRHGSDIMLIRTMKSPAKDLYDQDFFLWTVQNADLLRQRRFQDIDAEHLAEEIEDMGKSQRRALESRLEVLLVHLLKWQFQPEWRSASWRATLRVQRSKIAKLLRQAPSLRGALEEDRSDAYENAVAVTAAETGLAEAAFPEGCRFTLDQILDPAFFPG